jgi:hypothetical protein
LLVNGGVRQTVGFHQINHQRDEAVHVVTGGNGAAVARVRIAGFDLFLARLLAIAPERHYRVAGLGFIIGEIEAHAAFPAAASTSTSASVS